MNPSELKAAYERGENIIALLRKKFGSLINTEEFIEISYDLQAGSYISAMEDPVYAAIVQNYAGEIARILRTYGAPTSLLEAGVGEATTMARVLKAYGCQGIEAHGFDLSWSRIHRAKVWLARERLPEVTLCTASLEKVPYADNSFDVVYTSHSIEPNGGREAEIIAELYRVASRYLILLEPAYELATREAQARMAQHGYCRDLCGHAERLGLKVIAHQLFPVIQNPLNPTGLSIIEKGSTRTASQPKFQCPKYQTPLMRYEQVYYSPGGFTVYPIIAGIPCLRVENAITASLFSTEIAGLAGHGASLH
jgi:SAM-dependent methyltransferase